MNDVESKPQLTSLLDNELLAYVERLRIHPMRRRTNRAQGEHLAGKGGSSIELSDYRDYVPELRGDDGGTRDKRHRGGDHYVADDP